MMGAEKTPTATPRRATPRSIELALHGGGRASPSSPNTLRGEQSTRRSSGRSSVGSSGSARSPSPDLPEGLTRYAGPLFVSLREPHSPRSHQTSPTAGKRQSERAKRDRRRKLADQRRAFSRAAEDKVGDQTARLNLAEQERKYLEMQRSYAARQAEEKRQLRQDLATYTEQISRAADERRQQENNREQERTRRAAERLAQQAREREEAEIAARREKKLRDVEQAREMEGRVRKAHEERERMQAMQLDMAATRRREKAERAEKEGQERLAAQMAMDEQRRAQRRAQDHRARLAAETRAAQEAAVKAKFKASEERRIASEARKAAEHKAEQRRMEREFRGKIEEGKRAERAALRERERLMQRAAKEAAMMQFVEDENGKLTKIEDPGIVAIRQMRELEAENARVMHAPEPPHAHPVHPAPLAVRARAVHGGRPSTDAPPTPADPPTLSALAVRAHVRALRTGTSSRGPTWRRRRPLRGRPSRTLGSARSRSRRRSRRWRRSCRPTRRSSSARRRSARRPRRRSTDASPRRRAR